MRYRLKDATNRQTINLKNYSQDIISGICAIFPNVSVHVYSNYFEILNLPNNVSNSELRNMGRKIADRNSELHALAKVYNYTRSNGAKGKSVQLFERFNI